MEFSKVFVCNHWCFAELYRYAGTYKTGIMFFVRPWIVTINISILGFSLIVDIGKDIEE